MYILYINYVLVKYWICIFIIGKINKLLIMYKVELNIYIVYVLYEYRVCKLWVSKEFKIFLI